MWLIAETHRDHAKRPTPYQPADFNPCQDERPAETPMAVPTSVVQAIIMRS